MKKRVVVLLLLMVFFSSLFSVTAFADMGPKPSVVVDFQGLEGEIYYVTLLAKESSTGPYSWAGEGYSDPAPQGKEEVWQAFLDYRDPDGFFFLQYMEDCSGKDRFFWSYYPPEEFKILVYFPEYNSFSVSSESFAQYAFDSYFTATVSGDTVIAERTYDMGWEVFAFLFRLLLTLAIELLFAWAFGFKTKELFLTVLAVNVVTQLGLNLFMLYNGYESMFLFYLLTYFVVEVVIVVVEAMVYIFAAKRWREEYSRQLHPVQLAVIANLFSFVLGYIVSQWFPFVF